MSWLDLVFIAILVTVALVYGSVVVASLRCPAGGCHRWLTIRDEPDSLGGPARWLRCEKCEDEFCQFMFRGLPY